MVGPASQYYTFSIYISLPKNRCIIQRQQKKPIAIQLDMKGSTVKAADGGIGGQWRQN